MEVVASHRQACPQSMLTTCVPCFVGLLDSQAGNAHVHSLSELQRKHICPFPDWIFERRFLCSIPRFCS